MPPRASTRVRTAPKLLVNEKVVQPKKKAAAKRAVREERAVGSLNLRHPPPSSTHSLQRSNQASSKKKTSTAKKTKTSTKKKSTTSKKSTTKKAATKKKSTSAKKRKARSPSPSRSRSRSASRSPATKKTKTSTKKVAAKKSTTKKKSTAKKPAAKKPAAKKAASKKKKVVESEDEEDEEDDDEEDDDASPAPKAKKKAKAAKPAKASKADDPITIAANALNLAQLKARLRDNSQLVGGTKGELVKRVVDAVKNGCIPRCPSCHGGQLKNDGSGGYLCKGYFDDGEYQHCSYTTSSVVRPAWTPAAGQVI